MEKQNKKNSKMIEEGSKIMKTVKYYSLIFFLIVTTNSYGQGISINSTKDSIYLSDDFNIEGMVLTNENGSTGIGWADKWTYETGNSSGVAIEDGYIYCTKGVFGIYRTLVNPIKFIGSTYYISFLFKKNKTGNFRISGCRLADRIDRFGIHIKADGRLGAQAGTNYENTVVSSESFVENDKAYLLVAKYYYTTKPNMNISVYSANDKIPTDEPSEWDLKAEGMATGMEAIEYFRLAFTASTVSIDELKVGDTWKSVSTTDISTAFPEIKPVVVANSDVQSIYQESTSETKSWTYDVTDVGDYQLGYAWIWVEGENDEVDLEVKRGNETIKTFTAKSAAAPYRFETRIEDLIIGEQISVSATPKQGASYKMSYRLAFATPTFHNLPVFDVASYGAVGDGSKNDYESVKNALSAAIEAGGGIVTFNGTKTYYIEGPENYAMFDFINISNLKVEGNGAKIILHPKGNFIRMDNSENIHIDGFTTTYNPLPYFQGKITAINVNELYLDMQVDERYDAPVTGKYGQISDIFGRSFWNTIPGTKMGEGRHLSVDSTAQNGSDDHSIRVFLQDHETTDIQHTKSMNATDYIIPHKDYGHTNGYRDAPYCHIKRSSRVTISNLLTNSACHFGYSIGGNFGPITFSNTDMLAPNEEDMHVVWRDGWHVWSNRYGIMIEDGDFDGGYMYDDIFSPHVMVPIVESTSGTTVRLQSKPGESYEKYTDKPVWQVGDLVSFWDENQKVYYGMARITEVNKTKSLSLIDITLDSIIAEVVAGTYAINEETLNRDMVIRNCTSTPKGRNTAVRQRTPILYQDCDFQNIHFWTYCGEPWRTRPRNVVFERCKINERNTFNVDDTWNITIKNCTINAGQVDVSNCPRIVIDSIYFTNIDGDAIKLRSFSHAYVFGDYAYNGDSPALTLKVNKDIQSTINFSKPDVYPSYAPPFLVGIKQKSNSLYISEQFDIERASLVSGGSGIGWEGTWTSSDNGVSINIDTSLVYPTGVRLNTMGGRIFETQGFRSNFRLFKSPISLASGTFYLSFLAKKSPTGSFYLETNNTDNYSRYGVGVAGNGIVSAKSGADETKSSSNLFLNDNTYFVLVKFTNEGGNSAITRVKLYKNGDEVPADDTDISWDVESSPVLTGVDQDRLIIKINSGTVELDEILIGSSFQSVTYNEEFMSTNLQKAHSFTKHKLVLQHRSEGVNVIIPCKGGKLTLYDSIGGQLYSSIVNDESIFIADALFKSEHGINLIQYQTKNKYYIAKIIR